MIGKRIKEERLRLGLTQPDFADICGAKKRTLIEWEKGKTSPNTVQLSALNAAGVDVLYVVTGERKQKYDQSKSPTVGDLIPLSTESSVRVEGVQAEILKKNLLYRLKEDTKDHGKQAAEGLAGYQPLRPDQLALLDNLAHCPEEVQDAIRKLALVSARSDKDKKESGTK